MKVRPLNARLLKYLKSRKLEKKFERQLAVFLSNPKHPSLRTEILEPKSRKVCSFRIDKKYRSVFIFRNSEIEIIDINDHYQK